MYENSMSLLARSIATALESESNVGAWRAVLDDLDTRIRRLSEEAAVTPDVPTELRDEYRNEIDALSLENATLCEQLEKTAAALERAKSAYRDESHHNALLAQKLDVLEERLAGVLRKRVIG